MLLDAVPPPLTQVTSKGLLLYASQEQLRPPGVSVHTLSLPVSAQMAPTFKVLVYHVTDDGELLSDAITLPVDGIGSRHVSGERELCPWMASAAEM